MNPNDVIESYLSDVMRRLPRRERNEIGLELRGLLADMLAERSGGEGTTTDDATVLAALRDFGSPAEVAARYRSPGIVIIPADQTRTFAVLAILGVGLQWALTLPRVFQDQPLTGWWLSWGLGSFWWPGLMVMLALLGAGLRRMGWLQPVWRPRVVDPDRINRGAMAFGLVWFVIGVAFMVALPWIVGTLPDPVRRVFTFDPGFLHGRAWPMLLLWLGMFVVTASAFSRGRWSALTRRLEMLFSLACAVLLTWWLLAGPIFQARLTDRGAKAGIVLVVFFICVDLLWKLYRRRARIRVEHAMVK